ncbi:hypothetical protein [Clostridium simiarum]|nr:hypothetical protein [Clostridium simiarum]
MMIKMTDGDSFEANRSLVQELTFNRLDEELQKRGLEFTEVQMKNLGILSCDDIYTNMGLLVSDQCKHSIKFAIFQGTDKLVFRDRKELTGSLFAQLADAYKTIDFYNGTKATFHDLLRTDERDYPEDEKYLPILRLFEKQKEITGSDVEEALGIGTTHAINMLKEMIDKDLISKVGNGRLTKYIAK